MLEIKHTITTEEETSQDGLNLKVSGFDLFEDRGNGEIVNPIRLYFAYFGKVPSVKRNWGTDFNSVVLFIEKEWENLILKTHFTELNVKEKPHSIARKNIYVLKKNMLISIDDDGGLDLLYDSGVTGYNKIASYIFQQILNVSLKSQDPLPQQ